MQDKRVEMLKKLNGKLLACRKVNSTISTQGWTDIVQPMLDRMIQDIIGGRTGEFWDAGNIKQFSEFKTEWLLGYRQALIDFHNRVWNYKAQEKNIEKQITEMENQKERVVAPLQDSSYAPRETI